MRQKKTLHTALQSLSKQKAVILILLLVVIMLIFQRIFFRINNLLQIFNSVSVNMILAAGVTVVIICGGCDLSIGNVLGLTGILTIFMYNSGVPSVLAILIAAVIGAVIGFVNGFFVVHQKTEPFIITLGTGLVIKGISQTITDAQPVPAKDLEFLEIANGKLFGIIPNMAVYMLVVLVVLHLVLRRTQYGRNCFAVGGDYDVAEYAGIHAERVKWIAFVISGITAGLGGALNSSLLNTGNCTYGDTVPLLVQCGAVIGGTSLLGGIGGIPQTFVGLISLTVLQNCMNMLGISVLLQDLAKGLVIVFILWTDYYIKKRKVEAV